MLILKKDILEALSYSAPWFTQANQIVTRVEQMTQGEIEHLKDSY